MNNNVFDKTKNLFVSFSMARRLVIQLEDNLEKKLGRKPTDDELGNEMERVAKSYQVDKADGGDASES
jgi:hypothetical protein